MTARSISQTINHFIKVAIDSNLIHPLDEIYLQNQLLDLLHLDDYFEPESVSETGDLLDYMDEMVGYAIQEELIKDYQYEKEIFEAKIMNLLTPLPSEVNQHFWQLYNKDKIEATNYFYELSQKNDYIKTRNIAKNIFFETASPYGNLEITINLSKPEKDPKEIAAMGQKQSTNYPKCVLCMENEGYRGHANHAARSNHRVIRMAVQDEVYGLQYSPYVYYNEHSIFLNAVHKPMTIDRRTIENLIAIIDLLPHYFVGSNADLPIVGGSILAHDHYQGGHYPFPIEDAKVKKTVHLSDYPNVKSSILNWPLSVIRLSSVNKEELIDAVTHIMTVWEDYSDNDHSILSHSGDIRHNTITPIARFKDGEYEVDVVLRNNRTTEEFPDGIFHPHPDVHHIKKENIGLIEVMGLAILPARLVNELKEIEDFLLDKISLSQVTEMHQGWAQELSQKQNTFDETNVTDFVKQKVGEKFTRVLEDAGVFKQNENGIKGFEQFIDRLNRT